MAFGVCCTFSLLQATVFHRYFWFHFVSDLHHDDSTDMQSTPFALPNVILVAARISSFKNMYWEQTVIL